MPISIYYPAALLAVFVLLLATGTDKAPHGWTLIAPIMAQENPSPLQQSPPTASTDFKLTAPWGFDLRLCNINDPDAPDDPCRNNRTIKIIDVSARMKPRFDRVLEALNKVHPNKQSRQTLLLMTDRVFGRHDAESFKHEELARNIVILQFDTRAQNLPTLLAQALQTLDGSTGHCMKRPSRQRQRSGTHHLDESVLQRCSSDQAVQLQPSL